MIKNAQIGQKKLTSNILGSSVYKVITIATNLLLVRACVNYMGEEKYGIWLTLLSFFTWFSVLEVGISNNFRNKLTQYFTNQNHRKGKQAVTKIYRSIGLTYLIVSIILIVGSLLFPIDRFFLPSNYRAAGFESAFRLSTFLYMMFYISFALNTILLAVHHTKITYLIGAAQSICLLIGIYLFNYLNIEPSFMLIFSWFTAIPLIFWTVSNLVIFKTKLSKFSPSITQVFSRPIGKIQKIKSGFFIIQLCTLIIFSTDNFIIINTLSGTDVLKYNVAFKYFNILIVMFNLVLVPYWSTFTEAATLKNKGWITTHIKKLIFIWAIIAMGAIVLLFFADFAYQLWIGKALNISTTLSAFMALSVLLTAWNSIFAYFLNAITVVKRQTILLIFSALINIPISLYLIPKFNAAGVIIATCIALLPLSIILPLQYRSIIQNMK